MLCSKLFRFSLLLVTAVSVTAADLQSNSKLETIAKLTATIISQRHYSQQPLNDKLSSRLFDEYLKTIDPSRVFFTRDDIRRLDKYRYSLDDQIAIGSLDFAFLVYNQYMKRFEEYTDFADKMLKKGFDFNEDEDFTLDRSKADWPADEKEMKDLWRKRIKNAVLSYKLMDQAAEYEEKMAAKGEGKKGKVTKAEAAKRDETEKMRKIWGRKSAEERLDKFLQQAIKELRENEPIEVLSLYLTSLTRVYDPHSAYLSPSQEESFNIQMKLSLVGIGALLSSEDGYTKIVRVIPGGPADKDGRLKPEDRLIAVGQDGEEPVDIIDMPLNKVVQLIRGPVNSKVSLTVLPAEKGKQGIPKVITIVRNKVELKEQEATGRIEKFKSPEGKEFKIGIITLPSFYMDFNEAARGTGDYKSSTSDVAKILKDFNQKGVDGLVLDLRSNGGGSLQEAITLTGLFIKTGPVVQIKDSLGRVMVKDDVDDHLQYSGPLLVLVNKLSASATEIFAGAIKDYKRGVIVGDTHTHGKGTVQTVFELRDLLSIFGVNFDAGAIKFTNAKFYRINGASTQLKGVEPDIRLPSFTDTMKIGESDIDYALPWDAIKGVDHDTYVPNLDRMVDTLRKHSDRRLNSNVRFKALGQDIEMFKRFNSKKTVSLNRDKRWKEYLHERKLQEEQTKLLRLNDKDEVASEKDRKDDLYMLESVNILMDYIGMLNQKTAPAATATAAAQVPQVRKAAGSSL